MKLNDAVWGVLFAVLSVAILFHVQSFPRIPGQNVGPALFPGIVAAGMGVCALLLIARGRRARRVGAGAGPWFEAPAWLRSRRHVAAFVVLIVSCLLYLLVVERLGFVITAFLCLAALMSVLRVRPRLVLPVALVMTLLIHYAFYKLLRVPLPWGLLQGLAW